MPAQDNQQRQAVEATNFDFLQKLNKYIPSLVLMNIVEASQSNSKEVLPKVQAMNTIVLFADISGFTKVGEACAKKGLRGNEELAFVINRYMEGMVSNLSKYGGDIIKFVGDAMIVMWPEEKAPRNETELQQKERYKTSVRKAIHCSLDIQNQMNDFQVLSEVSSLSVKIGIGFGPCSLLYVGGTFQRGEFFTIGPALTCALKSEEMCTEGGQIVVNQSAYKYVQGMYDVKNLTNAHGDTFALINRTKSYEQIRTKADAIKLRAQISPETYTKIAPQIKRNVPAAIIPYLQIGSEAFGSETRSLTVMFASLGVELSSAETKQGMNKIQKIVTCVQEQVYRHGGSVNKLVMDDKGSTLICLWGLVPMAHGDDASRAILTAMNMRRELKKLENTWCNIGISSGEMFSGVVGTSGGRKEFSVLGDVVNLAARIMAFEMKKVKGKIRCDLNTKILASNQFSFLYGGHQEFKGKSISLPIFEPIDPEEHTTDITKKFLAPSIFLKPHMNPLSLESCRTAQKAQQPPAMIGEKINETLDSLRSQIRNYFRTLHKAKEPYIAAVRGEAGSGKTLFARCLIEDLEKDDDDDEQSYDSDEGKNKIAISFKNSVLCSSLNSESQYSFLNAWRPILMQMATLFCKREKVSREQLVVNLVSLDRESYEKYINALCLLFCAEPKQCCKVIQVEQVPLQVSFVQRPIPFVQRENYAEVDRQCLYQLILAFFKLYLTDETLNEESSQNDTFRQQPPRQKQVNLTIILDTTQLIDAASWELFEQLRSRGHGFALLLMQLIEMGEPVVNKEAKSTFDSIWYSSEKTYQIDIPLLDKPTLNKLILTLGTSYKETHVEEIEKMTVIVDPATSIRKPADASNWASLLLEKWQCGIKFNSIDDAILTMILRRTLGNPLLALDYFVQLLQNGFITNDYNGQVRPTSKFNECTGIQDFVSVPVPRFFMKQNLAMIDDFVQSISDKKPRRPGEYETCIRAIVLMKAASILGDEFEAKSLQAIYSQVKKQTSQKDFHSCIKMLESHNFIEVMDETDKSNVVYRFSKPFLRESIYQIILFRDQKQIMHKMAADYFLKNQGTLKVSNKKDSLMLSELRYKQILRHKLIAEELEEQKDLPTQSRKDLTVNRILNLLSNDPIALVKKGKLQKQGHGANRKLSERLITVSIQALRWYHDEDELLHDKFLGSIALENIYQVLSQKTSPENGEAFFAFTVKTTQWSKAGKEMQEFNQTLFVCQSEFELDEWTNTIEFLRTKAIIDAYSQKAIPVQFGSTDQKARKKREERSDKSNYLFDFGTQIKSIKVYQRKDALETKQQQISQTQVQETAQKLAKLYGIGMTGFMHHMSQASVKLTVKQQLTTLGVLPESARGKIVQSLADFATDNVSQAGMSEASRSKEAQVLKRKDAMQVKQSPGRQQRSIQPLAESVDEKRFNVAPRTVSEPALQESEAQVTRQASDIEKSLASPPSIITEAPPKPFSQQVSTTKLGQSTIEETTNFEVSRQDPPLSTTRVIVERQPSSQQIQQLIQPLIQQSLTQLSQHNNTIMEQQTKELKEMIRQQSSSLLNQGKSKQNESMDSPYPPIVFTQATPQREHRLDLSKQISDLSPVKSFVLEQLNNQGGGVSSKSKRRRNHPIQSKNVENEDSDNVEDPDSPKTTPVPRQQKRSKAHAQSQQVLINFKDEKLHYPPPERWREQDQAFFLGPGATNRVMNLDDSDDAQQSADTDQAVCIRDCECALKGSLMRIKEGAVVRVVKRLKEQKMMKIFYRNQQGLFKVNDFTTLRSGKPVSQVLDSIEHVNQQARQPVASREHTNFFKQRPEKDLQAKMNQLSTNQIAQFARQILESDHAGQQVRS